MNAQKKPGKWSVAMSSDWIVVREYASQLEADLVVGLLEANEIPYQIEGPPIGVFGPGFSGPTSSGVRLLVPAARSQEASELLDDDEE
jgi:hypothetical protein